MLIPFGRFNNFFNNPFDLDLNNLDFDQLSPKGVTIERYTQFTPRVDISEDENHYYIEADIPDFEKKDLQIQVENDILILKGKKEENIMEERKTYLHRERISSHFDRRFKLPEGTDFNKIEADFQKNKLFIKIPKLVQTNHNSLNIEIK